MQLEKPKQPLQGQKPNLIAHKDLVEKKALTQDEQEELNAYLRDGSISVSMKKTLLDNGANIETADSNGWTPLISSAFWGRTEECAFLLSRGANVRAKDNAGWTALINAANGGHIKACAVLIENGADIFMTNDKGQTALMVAESKRLNEMAAFLRFFESLGRQGYVSFISDFRNCISGGP